jgi:hypothetical protein
MVRHPCQLLEKNHECANSFTPLRLGAIKTPNRLVMTPLTRRRGSGRVQMQGLRPAQSRLSQPEAGRRERSFREAMYLFGSRRRR